MLEKDIRLRFSSELSEELNPCESIVAGDERSVQTLEPYKRRVLVNSSRLEVMFATWRPGIRCAPHDHGGAKGLVLLLSGNFVERTFALREGRLEVIGEKILKAPAITAVGVETIHDVVAPQGGRSLHIYVPGAPSMRVFDVDRGELLVVRGGAWVPSNTSNILRREPLRGVRL